MMFNLPMVLPALQHPLSRAEALPILDPYRVVIATPTALTVVYFPPLNKSGDLDTLLQFFQHLLF